MAAPDLISPDEAHRLIASCCQELKSVTLALDDALGHIAAESVRSSLSLPAFDNSAMDGYAYRAADVADAKPSTPIRLEIAGVVYAGEPPPKMLAEQSAYRIMTGSPLPIGADTVVAQENVVLDGSSLVFEEAAVLGRHVRRRGEEIEKGATVLQKGSRIHPGAIGALAAAGRDQIEVVRKPVVYLVTTGDETVKPGKSLRPGQIYNSNAPMLRAALADAGVRCESRHVRDDPKSLAEACRHGLKNFDVVIFVGGVSVGAKDYLRSVLSKQGVKEVFWRVSQKPGKPLYFGTQGKRLVFGLPGNPASAFTCFYVYALPALQRLAGVPEPGLPRVYRGADGDIAADAKKTLFLKATATRVSVEPHAQQGSHMITSLVKTNSLVVVPPGDVAAHGEKFETLILPYAEEGSD